MPVIIVITPPPKKPPTSGNKVVEIPAVADSTIADQLRDAADILDGLQPE